MSTTTELVVVFSHNGLDAIWAIYVLLAVGLSSFVFLRAYALGNYFFQDEDLRV